MSVLKIKWLRGHHVMLRLQHDMTLGGLDMRYWVPVFSITFPDFVYNATDYCSKCLVKRHMISTTYEHSFIALGCVLQDYPMRWVSWYDFRTRCVSQSNSSRPGVATIKSPYETMMKDNKLPGQTISIHPNTSQFALWKYLAGIAKINTRL